MERCIVLKKRIDELTQFSLHTTELGISKDRICKEEVVVSLTSYGTRFYDCYLAVESIMQGSVKPNRIVLWVSDTLKNETVPILLQNQVKRGLEIRYSRDIRSYTKLIYALKEFPNAAVITIDDDIMYPYDTIENLVNVHNDCPGMICSNVVRPFPENIKSHYVSLLKWDWVKKYKEKCERYIFEGYSGVLYPPHSLNEEVFNEHVFMDICKYADDVWFSAMAMLNKTQAVCVNPHEYFFKFIDNDNVQGQALKKINSQGDILNDQQILDVFNKYNLIEGS